MKKVFLMAVFLAVVVLAGCGSQYALLQNTPDGVLVKRSFWDDGRESLGTLAVNLAKAKNTTPENAVEMSTAKHTDVNVHVWGSRSETSSTPRYNTYQRGVEYSEQILRPKRSQEKK